MRLEPAEIERLIEQHKKLKRLKDGDKLKCVIYWGKGYTWEQIKEILFVSDGTIKTWLDIYQKKGMDGLLKSKYYGNHHHMTPAQEQIVCNYIDNYNVMSSLQVVQYVQNRFGIRYTVNGMTKTLIRLGFSYKKPKRAPAKIDSFAEASFKKNYFLKSETLPDDESIYFMDGSGFEHNAKIDYGWIRRGKNKMVKTNTGRKRLNVNGAYNIKNHEVVSICQEENVNTQSNIELLKKIVSQNTEKKKITVILDNASFNKNKAIFEFIKEQNKSGPKLELMYIPPYSPHLNLIERFWKFMKRKLLANQYYSSFSKFKAKIEYFLNSKLVKLKKNLRSLMTEKFQKVCDTGKLQI